MCCFTLFLRLWAGRCRPIQGEHCCHTLPLRCFNTVLTHWLMQVGDHSQGERYTSLLMLVLHCSYWATDADQSKVSVCYVFVMLFLHCSYAFGWRDADHLAHNTLAVTTVLHPAKHTHTRTDAIHTPLLHQPPVVPSCC
jgi:hypothetical protein